MDCHDKAATIGFEGLSRVFGKSSKSLMRMFGPKRDTLASNLFAVIHYLHEQEAKARKVAKGAVWQRSIGYCFGQVAGFFEHGIFHGINTYHKK